MSNFSISTAFILIQYEEFGKIWSLLTHSEFQLCQILTVLTLEQVTFILTEAYIVVHLQIISV